VSKVVVVGIIVPVLPETCEKGTKEFHDEGNLLTHRLSACKNVLHEVKVKESPLAYELRYPNFALKGKKCLFTFHFVDIPFMSRLMSINASMCRSV
jgi:hypothetical protein